MWLVKLSHLMADVRSHVHVDMFAVLEECAVIYMHELYSQCQKALHKSRVETPWKSRHRKVQRKSAKSFIL